MTQKKRKAIRKKTLLFKLSSFSTTNRYLDFSKHWTPAGHDFVCAEIERRLTNTGSFTDLTVR